MKESEVTCAHDIAVRHTTNSNKQGIIIAGILIADALDRIAACLPAPKPAAPKAKRTKKAEDMSLFDWFWAVWPKGRKKAKPKAVKAWTALNPSRDLAEKIRKDVIEKVASKDWRKDGGQFIPYPATYIRGRRWEDEGVETGASIDDGKTVTPEGSGY